MCHQMQFGIKNLGLIDIGEYVLISVHWIIIIILYIIKLLYYMIYLVAEDK